jgi:phosphoserine phosphatase
MFKDLSIYTSGLQLHQGNFEPIYANKSVKNGHPYRLFAFDMDSTLIQTEVINELAYEAGVGKQVSAITKSAMLGEIDFTESFRKRVSLLAGLDVVTLKNVAKSLPVTKGAGNLMISLKRLGFKTAIISGGFNYFAQYLQQKLGFDYIYANTLETLNDKLTGRVLGEIVDGPKKAELLRQIAARERLSLKQTVAVGDGANDLFMMAAAGIGVAFNAKPIVREQADLAIANMRLDGLLALLGIQEQQRSDKQFGLGLNIMLRKQRKNQVLRNYHA